MVGAGHNYSLGATGGEATHKLTVNEMPSHDHKPFIGWQSGSNYVLEYNSTTRNVGTDVQFMAKVGGDQPHNNLPPYLAVNIWKRTA